MPGSIDGFLLAFTRYGSGKLTRAEVVKPARRLADEGWTVTPFFARDLQAQEKIMGRLP